MIELNVKVGWFDAMSIRLSSRLRKVSRFLPCPIIHRFYIDDWNACLGFTCERCGKYILAHDYTKERRNGD